MACKNPEYILHGLTVTWQNKAKYNPTLKLLSDSIFSNYVSMKRNAQKDIY